MRILLIATLSLVIGACSSKSASPPTGQACTRTEDCYPGIPDAGALKGTVVCLGNLQGGYCTHTCQTDTDCCAAAGECPTGLKEVCAPLESAPQTYCFVSCESADIAAAADAGADTTGYCHQYANASFTCRSTGGGSANKKFCGP